MTREEQLRKEIEECRAQIRDNTRAIDPATRQILLDTIRTNKAELDKIDSDNRASSRIIVSVDAPTGRSVVAKTNSNHKRIIESVDNIVRVGVR